MTTLLKETPTWLRAETSTREIKVDREANVLRGYVVAQEGPFKSKGRGEFSVPGLKKIVTLMNRTPGGLKSRFAHPTLSADGLGKFLGRVKNAHLDSVRVKKDGELVLLHAVRGDLHFDKTALEEPPGGGKPLGLYVMDLAESDPDAISSSLVIEADEEEQLDPKTKKPLLDAKGEPRPPIWHPKALHASDVVDTGDAVDGILGAQLSTAGLPDELVRQASALLNKAFPGQTREVIRARLSSWLDSYLDYRFGDEPFDPNTNDRLPGNFTVDGNITLSAVELAKLTHAGADEDVEVQLPKKGEPHPSTTCTRGVAELQTILAEKNALGTPISGR